MKDTSSSGHDLVCDCDRDRASYLLGVLFEAMLACPKRILRCEQIELSDLCWDLSEFGYGGVSVS